MSPNHSPRMDETTDEKTVPSPPACRAPEHANDCLQHRLQRLFVTALAGALLVAALLIAALHHIQRIEEAGEDAHGLLLDARRLLVREGEKVLAAAQELARRSPIRNALVEADPTSPRVLRARRALPYELAETLLASDIAVYDHSGRLIAWRRGKDGELCTEEEGECSPTAASLPEAVPGSATAFGMPVAPYSRLRRVDGLLREEAIAPVWNGGGTLIGWVWVAETVDLAPLAQSAQARDLRLGLVFAQGKAIEIGDLGLRPEALGRAPLLMSMAERHRASEMAEAPGRHIDAARLELTDGESAWFVVEPLFSGQGRKLGEALIIAAAVFAGVLLVLLPIGRALLKRWVVQPIARLGAGLEAIAAGDYGRRIEGLVGGEFGLLAADINRLAAALEVREAALVEAGARWRTIIEALEAAGLGIYVIDGDHRVHYKTPGVLPFADAAATDAPCHLALFGNPTPCPFCPLARTVGAGETVRLLPPPISGRSFEIIAMPLAGPDGERWQLSLIQDVSQRIARERQLRQAATVFEAASQAIFITDPQGVIRHVNPAFTALTGFAAAEAIGRTPAILASGRHEPAFFAAMWRAIHDSGFWEGEIWNRRKDGEIFPTWETINAVRDEGGEIVEFVAMFTDITQKKKSEAEIAYRANYDALTGLPNRNLLSERVEQAMRQAHREGGRLALMFIDLDLFKEVNDTLGHAIGDRLLQAVAERMCQCVRETDTVARLGGDEFVVLLPEVEDGTAAGRVADKILAQLSRPILIDEHEIVIGASIGITVYPDDGSDVDTLFRNADLAMYRAKDAGRNNAQFFEAALTAAALERRQLETDLRGAVTRGEMRLLYQPVVALADGRVIGAEALLRWQHPSRGELLPDRFIAVAEDSGMIREIGQWVLETCCRQLASWRAAGWMLTLSLNVSVRQLPDALSVEWLVATLARHGLTAEDLTLEITESVLLTAAPAIQAWFAAAGAAGLRLALDDFGTGYSSLAYLRRYPVRVVKIDRSFVEDLASDVTDLRLVEAILAMARSLGLAVVAEGVENEEEAEILRRRGCEFAQGFFFGRPMSAEELGRRLAAS